MGAATVGVAEKTLIAFWGMWAAPHSVASLVQNTIVDGGSRSLGIIFLPGYRAEASAVFLGASGVCGRYHSFHVVGVV